MQNLSYQETIDWLFKQFPSYQNIGGKAYKPGLETIFQLLNHFGNPQKELRFIHVAGTNGKGSTCSLLASILTASGEKVGLFTSPHIQDFRERIRINGNMIPEQEVVEWTAAIKNADLTFEPSFFEITFLMALLHFKQNNCTVCVIETGLGGRLDATNCIQPILSLITNISLEHTNFLGNTLEEIAREKGGIIKEQTPVVIGERKPETATIFHSIAQKKNAPIYFAEDNSVEIPDCFPLLGSYQQNNFQLVHKGLSLLKEQFSITQQSIEQGLLDLITNTGFYGRMQIVSENPRVIFDVSHNEAGIKSTLEYFKEEKNLKIVYGTSADKDLEAIFQLFSKDVTYYFTTFSNERSANIEQLRAFAEKHNLKSHFFSNPNEALNSAKNTANKADTILVFGSFFLISDFFKKNLKKCLQIQNNALTLHSYSAKELKKIERMGD